MITSWDQMNRSRIKNSIQRLKGRLKGQNRKLKCWEMKKKTEEARAKEMVKILSDFAYNKQIISLL